MIVVGSLVLASILGTLVHQQRFYLVVDDILETRRDAELAHRLLIPELLPLNPSAGDVDYAGPDSMRLRAFRGVFSICDKKLTTDVFITVQPLAPGSAVLTSDSALVYSRGTSVSTADDHWKPLRISSVSSGTCRDGSPGETAVVHGLQGVLSEVAIGSPLRLFRHGSYWLAVEDDHWMMKTDAQGTPRAIGGQLMKASEPASAALKLRYLDAAGNDVTATSNIVDVLIDVGAMGNAPMIRGGSVYKTDSEIRRRLRNAGS